MRRAAAALEVAARRPFSRATEPRQVANAAALEDVWTPPAEHSAHRPAASRKGGEHRCAGKQGKSCQDPALQRARLLYDAHICLTLSSQVMHSELGPIIRSTRLAGSAGTMHMDGLAWECWEHAACSAYCRKAAGRRISLIVVADPCVACMRRVRAGMWMCMPGRTLPCF